MRAVDHDLGALLTQANKNGHEQSIYYINRMMVRAQHKYNPMEKGFCCTKDETLSVGTNISHHIQSKFLKDTDNTTRFIEFKACLVGITTFIVRHEIHPQKETKGQVIADFLAGHPMLEKQPSMKYLNLIQLQEMAYGRCSMMVP